MYVPGNDIRKLNKIPTLDVDSVILDCEDGVAVNRKEEARLTIQDMLGKIDFGRSEICVRVNSMSSGLAEEDLRAVMSGSRSPQTLLLPKVEDPAQLELFATTLDEALGGIAREDEENLRLIIYVESAVGLMNIKEICQRGVELSEVASFDLDAIIFGSDDYIADIGATRSKDASEVLLARQMVVMATKAFGLQAIDIVHTDIKDLEDLRAHCIEGAGMGFSGKQVIHPAQIPVVQEAFGPSAEKIEWAEELITAFTQHQQEGKGAFTFRGNMIDMPLLRQAENITRVANIIKTTHETS